MLSTTTIRGDAPPPYASLTAIVHHLTATRETPRAEAQATHTATRNALTTWLRLHEATNDEATTGETNEATTREANEAANEEPDEERDGEPDGETLGGGGTDHRHVAPVRLGPVGVVRHLLYESDRLYELMRHMPRARGVRLRDEAAWTAVLFFRHALRDVSRIARRSTAAPHSGGRPTLFDALPREALYGLVPIAAATDHVPGRTARGERLRRAASSSLLTDAERDIVEAALEAPDPAYFVDVTRRKQTWGADLWPSPAATAAARPDRTTRAEPHQADDPMAAIEALETAAAEDCGLTLAALRTLRQRASRPEATRPEAATPEATTPEATRTQAAAPAADPPPGPLSSDEEATLRAAAVRLRARAAAAVRQRPDDHGAYELDRWVGIARESADRFTTAVAVDMLNAADTAREALRHRAASDAAARAVRSLLPKGKPQAMCEIDYLGQVEEQVAEALDGIGHTVQSKRIVRVTDPSTADTAFDRLNEAFGGTCVLTGDGFGVTVRLPPPSEFGIALRGRRCDCGRHAAGRGPYGAA
ncbi:hypothetical protein [Streptomyces sp. NPDC003077]|uniref:hypothetical protein n=1 Tax=Streptomyces sp. NPDC003077 TaxID=3154443 RepID=UPI0033A19941